MDSSSTFIGEDNPEPDGQKGDAAAGAAAVDKLSDAAAGGRTAPKKDSVPRPEIIGDELKSVVLDPSAPGYNQIRRVCILDVDREWTIEAVHGHALKKSEPCASASTSGDSASGTTHAEPSASLAPSEDRLETDSGVTVYPHDADVVLRALDPSIHVETLYLRPDVRQSIAAIRRRKHTVDVFVNLYDRADETGQKIVDYMQNEGLAFTGAGSRFYDPTRMELKRLCRYSKVPTPAFAIVADVAHAHQLPEQLGGFPLFCKPEHGYDSVGIDEHSLIHTTDALVNRVAKIIDEFGSALVERYVDGREFSVLVAGAKGNIQCFPPVEYRFPEGRQPTASGAAAAAATGTATTPATVPTKAGDVATVDAVMIGAPVHSESAASTPSPSPSASPLPSDTLHAAPCCALEHSSSPAPDVVAETSSPACEPAAIDSGSGSGSASGGAAFITFEDKWGISFENRWFLVDKETETTLVEQLMAQSVKLYEAFEGEGLCRFDIRLDSGSGRLLVLDANPNCSTFYKDECTADTIMRLVDGWSKERFLRFLLDHALERQRRFHRAHAFVVMYCEEKGFSLHAARELAQGDLVYSDEEAPLRLITRDHAAKHWSAADMASFDAYAWPVGRQTYAIWDSDSAKWRPINHSCNPSAWMDGLSVVARRAVAKGEELTLDYATFEPTHPAFECWCGAAQCRQMIRPNEYREEWFQQRYGRFVSPHIRALQAQEAKDAERDRRHREELENVRAGLM